MSYQKIESLDHLNELLGDGDGTVECFIALKGGLRSSKRVDFDGVHYHLLNEIDNTWQDDLTKEQLKEETNIVKAIELGALYKYNYEE